MNKKRVDCIIGRDDEGKTALLIAPSSSLLYVGDKVRTDTGVYNVVFCDSYHTVDDVLMTALFVISGLKPEKIVAKIEQRIMEWEDDNDQER